MDALDQRARQQLGPGVVDFPGYVSEDEFEALLDGCAALIYPSLYEGFGMPVLEAMARGKPVLCSDATSLPEVAGDGAVYFDPTSAEAIARAIGSLGDREAVQARVVRGRARAAAFGGATQMGSAYLAAMDEVLAGR
jgi:glycosyltransferase involved in cell wall biosynthesis